MPYRRSYGKSKGKAPRRKAASKKRANQKKKSANSQLSAKFKNEAGHQYKSALRFNPGRPLRILPRKVRDVITYREEFVTEEAQTFGAVQRTYRGNSVFDPRFATGGGQPKGFDNYMALYNEFYVVKSKITVYYQLHSGTSTYYIAIRPHSDAVGQLNNLDFSTVAADKWAGLVNTKVICPSARDTSTSIHKLSMTMNTAKAMGRGHDRVTLIGTSAANPTSQWYWKVARNFTNGTPGSAPTITMTVIMSYDVIFSEPIVKSID